MAENLPFMLEGVSEGVVRELALKISSDQTLFTTFQPEVMQEFAKHISVFTDPGAQLEMVKAIREQRFGKTEDVSTILIKQYGMFTHEPAQDVLMGLLQNMHLNTPLQQALDILEALPLLSEKNVGKFIWWLQNNVSKSESRFIDKTIEYLQKYPVTEGNRISIVYSAFFHDIFSANPRNLLKAVQRLTHKLDPEKRSQVWDCIWNIAKQGKFGGKADILIEFITASPSFYYREAAECLEKKRFGDNHEVMACAFDKFFVSRAWGEDETMPVEAQRALARAAEGGVFSSSLSRLENFESIVSHIQDAEAKKIILNAAIIGQLGGYVSTKMRQYFATACTQANGEDIVKLFESGRFIAFNSQALKPFIPKITEPVVQTRWVQYLLNQTDINRCFDNPIDGISQMQFNDLSNNAELQRELMQGFVAGRFGADTGRLDVLISKITPHLTDAEALGSYFKFLGQHLQCVKRVTIRIDSGTDSSDDEVSSQSSGKEGVVELVEPLVKNFPTSLSDASQIELAYVLIAITDTLPLEQRKIIVEHLPKFSHLEAQKVLWRGIKDYCFGGDLEVLDTLALRIPKVFDAQIGAEVFKELKEGVFDRCSLTTHVNCWSQFDPKTLSDERQIEFANLLCNIGKRSPLEQRQMAVEHLPKFSHLEAQHVLWDGIKNNCCGSEQVIRDAMVQRVSLVFDSQIETDLINQLKKGIFKRCSLTVLAKCWPTFRSNELQVEFAKFVVEKLKQATPEDKEAVGKNLPKFTHGYAKLTLINGMLNNGSYSTEEESVITFIKEALLLKNVFVDMMLSLAIINRKFGDTISLIKAIIPFLSQFSNADAQESIMDALKAKDFGDNIEIQKTLVAHLPLYPSQDLQIKLAAMLVEKTFGDDPAVMMELVQHLPQFTDPTAQQMLAVAIKDQRFGTDPDVLLALAQHLPQFTDVKARQILLDAIYEQKFGTDPRVLRVLTTKLDQFMAEDTVRRLMDCIVDDKFGLDGVALSSLFKYLPQNVPLELEVQFASKLCSYRELNEEAKDSLVQHLPKFKSQAAQIMMAEALNDQIFGTEPHRLKQCIMYMSSFTDSMALIILSQAILNQKFSDNKDVLNMLAQHLPKFTSPVAIRNVVRAFIDGKFGTDSRTLDYLAQSPCFQAPAQQKQLITYVIGKREEIAIQDQLAIFSNFKYDSTGNAINWQAQKFRLFGMERERGMVLREKLKACLPDKNLNGIFNDDDFYTVTLKNNQLVVYAFQRGETQLTAWSGFSDIQNALLKVRVYDFGQEGEYPGISLGLELDEAHTCFEALPGFLKRAILDSKFSPSLFKHEKLMTFFTKTLLHDIEDCVESQEEKQTFLALRAIMQRSILAGGNYVSIASNSDTDVKIKNDINRLCTKATQRHDFSELVREFFNAATHEEKGLMAYLFGNLARAGVLGYHYEGSENVANLLFYSLARDCYRALNTYQNSREVSNFIIDPLQVLRNLERGNCIGIVSDRFRDDNISTAGSVTQPEGFSRLSEVYARRG